MNVQLVELERTHVVAPASWFGKTVDDVDFYARYRWGTLVVVLDNQVAMVEQIGGALDGVCTFKELCRWAANKGIIITDMR